MKKTTMPYTLSLNGRWVMDWLSDQPYTGEEEPQIRAGFGFCRRLSCARVLGGSE